MLGSGTGELTVRMQNAVHCANVLCSNGRQTGTKTNSTGTGRYRYRLDCELCEQHGSACPTWAGYRVSLLWRLQAVPAGSRNSNKRSDIQSPLALAQHPNHSVPRAASTRAVVLELENESHPCTCLRTPFHTSVRGCSAARRCCQRERERAKAPHRTRTCRCLDT